MTARLMPSTPSRRRVLQAAAATGGLAAVGLFTRVGQTDGGTGFGSTDSEAPWPGYLGGPRRTRWREAATGPAVDATTDWTREQPDGYRLPSDSFPAVDPETVYAPTVVESDDSSTGPVLGVTARSRADGRERWRTALDELPPNVYASYPLSAAVVDDVVVASTYDQTAVLERDTGDVRWTVDRGGYAPAVTRGLVLTVAPRDDGFEDVVCQRIDDGSEIWRTPTYAIPVRNGLRPPVADAKRAYVRRLGTVVAVSLDDGEPTWRTDVTGDDSEITGTAIEAVRDGVLVVAKPYAPSVEGSDDGGLGVLAVDADEGAVAWENRFRTGEAPDLRTVVGPDRVVVAANDVLVDGAPRAVVVALDRTTGAKRFRAVHEGRFAGRAFADGDHLYVGHSEPETDDAGSLCAYSLSDGSLASRIKGVPKNRMAALGDGACYGEYIALTTRYA